MPNATSSSLKFENWFEKWNINIHICYQPPNVHWKLLNCSKVIQSWKWIFNTICCSSPTTTSSPGSMLAPKTKALTMTRILASRTFRYKIFIFDLIWLKVLRNSGTVPYLLLLNCIVAYLFEQADCKRGKAEAVPGESAGAGDQSRRPATTEQIRERINKLHSWKTDNTHDWIAWRGILEFSFLFPGWQSLGQINTSIYL